MTNPESSKPPFKVGLMLGLTKDESAKSAHIAFVDAQIVEAEKLYKKDLDDLVHCYGDIEKSCEKSLQHFKELLNELKVSRRDLVEAVRKMILNFLPDEYPSDVKESLIKQIISAHDRDLESVYSKITEATNVLYKYASDINSSELLKKASEKYQEALQEQQGFLKDKLEFESGYNYGKSISQTNPL